jgi:hypothetical protein
MATRHEGLTQAVAANYLEAARVSLDRHHQPPVGFGIVGLGGNADVVVEWEQTNARVRGAWANHDDATRDGAYAVALAALELSEGLFALRRAETRTGADYYVGPPGTQLEDLEDSLRFEVSGVDKGALAVVEQRLREKLDQAARGASNLPAVAGVVGFRVRTVLLEHLAVNDDLA